MILSRFPFLKSTLGTLFLCFRQSVSVHMSSAYLLVMGFAAVCLLVTRGMSRMRTYECTHALFFSVWGGALK